MFCPLVQNSKKSFLFKLVIIFFMKNSWPSTLGRHNFIHTKEKKNHLWKNQVGLSIIFFIHKKKGKKKKKLSFRFSKLFTFCPFILLSFFFFSLTIGLPISFDLFFLFFPDPKKFIFSYVILKKNLQDYY